MAEMKTRKITTTGEVTAEKSCEMSISIYKVHSPYAILKVNLLSSLLQCYITFLLFILNN